MTSSILQTATRVLMPLLLLFAVFLLLRGHNRPGGGFVGGLVVASSFVLYSIAFGVDAARRAGQPFMTAQWTELAMGPNVVAIGTPLVFDVGVFLAVIGVVLTIVFTLADVSLSED